MTPKEREPNWLAMARTASQCLDIGYERGKGFTRLSQDREIIKHVLEQYDELKAAAEKVERLRAALEEIVSDCQAEDVKYCYCDVIAHKALHKPEGGE